MSFEREPQSPMVNAPEQPVFLKFSQELKEKMDRTHMNAIHGLGEVGTRLVATLKSDELSIDKKIQGVAAAGIGAVGEIGKWSLNTSPLIGSLNGLPGEKIQTATSAFIEVGVDSASSKIATKEEDGTYGFDATGIAEFVNLKGLMGVGVEAATVGTEASIDALHEQDPDSNASKALELVYKAYKSPAGKMVAKAATNAIKKRAA